MKYFLLVASIFFFGETFAQNNWITTNGPFGGYVSSLKRSSTGTLYSVISQRLYQSTNNGDTWILTPTTSPTQRYLNDLMIDTDGKMYAVNYSTLYTSADNGITWTTTASNLFQNGTKLEKVGPDEVFVVWGYSGVYVSIDKGVTWKQILTEQVSNGIGLDLSLHLLDAVGVSLVEGASFGASGTLRVSYATSDAKLTEAMARVARAVGELVEA